MEKVLSGVKKIHLVGIGGVGMSGLALLLKDKGFIVTGSDLKDSYNITTLKEEGIKVFIGHKRENLSADVDLLGFSSAVGEDNPELKEARKRGIRFLRRGELLGELCQDRKTIAIAGSHGKTTTTSLLGYLLTSLEYKPAVFLGGLPLNYKRGAWWGEEHFVIETDESDGSFLFYKPWLSVITNIDSEHLDYYNDLKALRKSFHKFASQTKEKVIAWGDDSYLLELISEVDGISFGWSSPNFIRGDNFRFSAGFSYFELYIDNKFILTVKAPLVGKHNCLNVLAAFSVFYHLGENLRRVNQVLCDFKGTKRRFQTKDKVRGVTFIDDYAHHPTEIKAVLSSACLLEPKRVVVVFQPHRFSRVKLLKDDFARCFSGADVLIVSDIYSASEKKINEISSEGLVSQIKRNFQGEIFYMPKDKIRESLGDLLKEGDLVLALGAGDIDMLMERVIDEFKKNRATI